MSRRQPGVIQTIHSACMKIRIGAQNGFQFVASPLIGMCWNAMGGGQILHDDDMEAGRLVYSQKVNLGPGDAQARKNGLIETQFPFSFERGGWTIGVDRFNDDRVARRVTLPDRGQGHPVNAAPSEGDLY